MCKCKNEKEEITMSEKEVRLYNTLCRLIDLFEFIEETEQQRKVKERIIFLTPLPKQKIMTSKFFQTL